jgi:hypothetical protein
VANGEITIRTYGSEIEALIGQAVLEAHGIRSVLLRDDAGGMQPALTFVHGVRLVVRADDADAAREALDGEGPREIEDQIEDEID